VYAPDQGKRPRGSPARAHIGHGYSQGLGKLVNFGCRAVASIQAVDESIQRALPQAHHDVPAACAVLRPGPRGTKSGRWALTVLWDPAET
jgi:hypothetical protein